MTRTNKYQQQPWQQYQGFALILVLWVIALLTIMAASFAQNMRRETLLISNIRDNAQAQAYAEAGLAYAQLMLINTNEELRWRGDGSLYQLKYNDIPIRVKIFEESGKIDINQSDETTLSAVFEPVTEDQLQSSSLVNAILDWRDSDDEVRVEGAEKDQYLQQGLSYQPRNRPFQTLEELQLVLGINAQIYNTVEPLLTVYSGQKTINPSKAAREVLLTLPDVTPEQVDIYLQERLENTKNGLPAPEFPVQVRLGGSGSQIYTIIVEALMPTGVKGRIQALIQSGGSNEQPFSISDWGQGFVASESFFQEQMNQLLVN